MNGLILPELTRLLPRANKMHADSFRKKYFGKFYYCFKSDSIPNEILFSDTIKLKPTVLRPIRHGISFWGFNDRDTWINHFFSLKDWPTLFDHNLDEKPAYYGFAEGLL
jgi:hypothetical protein